MSDKRYGEKRIHLSVDDVFEIFADLKRNEGVYTSAFEQPMLAFLKTLHCSYGAVFSLFCFCEDLATGQCLEQMSPEFAGEFRRNAHWLRFGFHGCNASVYYGGSEQRQRALHGSEEAAADYERVINGIIRIAGAECIDRMPRIHYYSGTQACCSAWRNQAFGICGLLAAEDERCAYYHTSSMKALCEAAQKDIWVDEKLGLLFGPTDLRLEQVQDMEQALECCQQKRGRNIELFTHEPYLLTEFVRHRMKISCAYAAANGWEFGFPENWDS